MRDFFSRQALKKLLKTFFVDSFLINLNKLIVDENLYAFYNVMSKQVSYINFCSKIFSALKLLFLKKYKR